MKFLFDNQPRALAATMASLLATLSPGAHAEEVDTSGPVSETTSTVAFGSFGYSDTDSRGIGANAGFVHAFNGDLGKPGITGMVNVGYYHSKSPGYRSESTSGSAVLSYLWPMANGYATIGAGPHVALNNERPSGGPADKDKVGVTIQYGFESGRENSIYIQSFGAYATTFDQVYVLGRLGYMGNTGIKFGAEATLYDDNISSGSQKQLGVFIGGMNLTDDLEMELSAGHQRGSRSPGSSRDNGVYAMVGFAIAL